MLAAQHPDLADLPLRRAASGWDNDTFRLGEELAVRLPRRTVAVDLLLAEQRWLPVIGDDLPLPVPVPVRRGEPGCGYPWPWSVVPWFAGAPADVTAPDAAEAAVLGRFLRALHRPAPADALRNPFRGVPLTTRAEGFDRGLAELPPDLHAVAPQLRAMLTEAMSAPIEEPPRWLHGDLHPRNVLVADGRLAAVLDWGDVTAGDPATDLAGLWMLFQPDAHPGFWAAYGSAGEELALRGRGWAAVLALILLRVGLVDGDPRFTAVGRRTLRRLTGT